MAKHVWKCDYCDEDHESFYITSDHEKECRFNPENKHCYTCANYKGDGFWIYGESYTCLKGKDVDTFESVGHCTDWE